MSASHVRERGRERYGVSGNRGIRRVVERQFEEWMQSPRIIKRESRKVIHLPPEDFRDNVYAMHVFEKQVGTFWLAVAMDVEKREVSTLLPMGVLFRNATLFTEVENTQIWQQWLKQMRRE